MEEQLNSLTRLVNSLKNKIDKIPMPLKFMYRPPEREHMNLVDYLNEIDRRLKEVEEKCRTL
jgi:hypothetical protein